MFSLIPWPVLGKLCVPCSLPLYFIAHPFVSGPPSKRCPAPRGTATCPAQQTFRQALCSDSGWSLDYPWHLGFITGALQKSWGATETYPAGKQGPGGLPVSLLWLHRWQNTTSAYSHKTQPAQAGWNITACIPMACQCHTPHFHSNPGAPSPHVSSRPRHQHPNLLQGDTALLTVPKTRWGDNLRAKYIYIYFNVCWKGHNISFQWQGICKLTRDFKYRMKKKLHLHFIRSLNKPHRHPFLKDTCCGSAGNQSPFKFLVFQFWWILGWDYLFKNSTAKQLAQWHLLSDSTNLQESGHGLSLVIHSYTL